MTPSEQWGSFEFDSSTTAKETPTLSPSASGGKKRCILLRGQENWLRKVLNDEQPEVTPEIVVEIRQEVRALSAQWLKMQNVCALIGAGASKYVTGFVGAGIFDRVKAILDKRPSGEILQKALKFVASPQDLARNFEEFLSQLTVVVRVLEGKFGPFRNLAEGWSVEGLGAGKNAAGKLEQLLLDIERAIIVACNVKLPESELTLTAADVTPHEAFLAKLVARDPQQGRGRLFTTNYDTLLEQAMDRLGIVYSDGFTGTVARRFNTASYDLDLYYPGEVTAGRVRRYDKVLHLYKLHGSINWRRSVQEAGDPFGILADLRPLPSEKEVLLTPETLDQIFINPNGGQPEQTLAILPTAAKFGESVTMPYAHLFRAMAQVLREPQTACFVIGYSGWDQHLNRIIEDALTNPGFTCVIVNPTLTDWAKKLVSADYSGRVYAIAGDWANFEFFAKAILPDLEILKTDLAIARTLRELQKANSPEKPGPNVEK
jgi:hypothetical protein